MLQIDISQIVRHIRFFIGILASLILTALRFSSLHDRGVNYVTIFS